MVNTSDFVGNTKFTVEFVLEKLRSAGQTDCSLENLDSLKCQDITGGAAFFSEIYSVDFKWRSDIYPKRVVLKIPKLAGIEHIKQSNDDVEFIQTITEKFEEHLERTHKVEESVYKYYAHASSDVKLPKFYYGHEYAKGSDKGIIIMEDLTQKGTTLKLIPGFNEEQIENLFDELAHFHAVSLMDRSWLETVNELPPDHFLVEMKEVIKQLKNIDGEHFDKLVDDIMPFVTPEIMKESYFLDQHLGFPPFLVHSDLWSSNILWKFDADKNPTNAVEAIIDWQMAAPGNPGIDISRVLAMNTSAQFRRDNTDRLLKHYLTCLQNHLGTPPPLSFDQLKHAYNQALGFCAVFIGYGTPSYYSMKSVVGDPASQEIRKELLSRCEAIFVDMLHVYKK